jgi:CHASE2 domain-containing sensor protein
MPLVDLILAIAAIGLLTWAVTTYIPMPEAIKRLIVGVVIIGVVVFLIGLWFPSLRAVRFGR